MLSITDRLALTRTDLANERTLLSYVRTALATSAAGVGLVEVFTDPMLRGIGWVLLPTGGLVLLAGLHRFRRVRRALRALDRANA